jgi:glucokinase
MTVLAVDVGGTKLAAALVDDDGTLRARARIPTGPGDPWSALVSLLDPIAAEGRVEGIGVGCGGPMTWPEGVVSPINIPSWRGFPLRDRLFRRYGVPVRVHNDAVAMTVGEHWKGAGQGVNDLLGIVVSTGVGGGLVLGGRLVDGASGNAGHIGHVLAEPGGPVCGCGARGCLEAVARGPATVAWARAHGCAAEDGESLARLAAAGDEPARAALARSGQALGRVIAWSASLLDVSVVVVGGGLAESGPALWDPLLAAVREHASLPFLDGLRVLPAALGADAGLLGAAALLLAEDRYWSGDVGAGRLPT